MSKLEDFEDIPYETDQDYQEWQKKFLKMENDMYAKKILDYYNNKYNKNTITIPLEAYENLLIIKGKYEELKNLKTNNCNGNCKKNNINNIINDIINDNINNGKHSCTDNCMNSEEINWRGIYGTEH